MLNEVIESKKIGRPTDALVKMWYGRIDHVYKNVYPKKWLPMKDDMQSYAMETLVRTWHKFDHELCDNPQLYFDLAINSSFCQVLSNERRILEFFFYKTPFLPKEEKFGRDTPHNKEAFLKMLLERYKNELSSEFWPSTCTVPALIRDARMKGFDFDEFKIIEKSIKAASAP